jgi:hypothetical protein
MPSIARRERDSARIHASINSGMRIRRSVCPVGAVSKTIRSKRSSSPRTSAPMRSNSAISSAPGMLAARSICRDASFWMLWPNSPLICSLTVLTYRAVSNAPSISRPCRFGSSCTGSGPIGRSNMSEVECAGSVETSSTRLPARLAASAIADAQVVLPTPPLPPKNKTRLSRRARIRVSPCSSVD